ncbi:MAG: electron transport complex subunit RsxG [Gammaproteobacteria bacterium]|nr:MAG: electron transport complex subunit RsxG [Gammaproteobacteria bacterium]
MLKQSIGFNSLVLAMFALITALLLAGTHLGTREQIEESERRAAEKALLEIIPNSRHTNDMLTDTVSIPRQFWTRLGLIKGGKVNVARKDSEIVALIVPAIAPDGYSGDISLIAGVNMDGTLAGVRVLSHTETPGLGDKINLKRSDWILAFDGKSLTNPELSEWQVKKDGGNFDQFTGATITPRAVVAQVKRVLEYFDEDRQRITKLIKSATVDKPHSKLPQENTR